jgi:hypothetical protein
MNEHRRAVILFGLAVAIVIAVASVTTLDRATTHNVSNEAPARTTGLARPHHALDRAPGQRYRRIGRCQMRWMTGLDVALSPSRGSRSSAYNSAAHHSGHGTNRHADRATPRRPQPGRLL